VILDIQVLYYRFDHGVDRREKLKVCTARQLLQCQLTLTVLETLVDGNDCSMLFRALPSSLRSIQR
jgi:hypothetical protein